MKTCSYEAGSVITEGGFLWGIMSKGNSSARVKPVAYFANKNISVDQVRVIPMSPDASSHVITFDHPIISDSIMYSCPRHAIKEIG